MTKNVDMFNSKSDKDTVKSVPSTKTGNPASNKNSKQDSYSSSVASGVATDGVAGFSYSQATSKTKAMEVITPTLQETGRALGTLADKLSSLGNTISNIGATYVTSSVVNVTFRPVQFEALNLKSFMQQLMKMWQTHSCPGLGCLRNGQTFFWTNLYLDEGDNRLTIEMVGVDGTPRNLELVQGIVDAVVEDDADATMLHIGDNSYAFGIIEHEVAK